MPETRVTHEPMPATDAPPEAAPTRRSPPLSRRQMLKLGAAAVGGMVGGRLLFDWLAALGGPTSAVPIDAALAGYDATAHRWGFVVDTNRCIGCGLCVGACKAENGVPPDAEHTRTWVERHTISEDGTVVVESPEAGINGFVGESAEPAQSGATSRFVPRLCMQCENSPCTAVCPVGATYRTPDGVILVDEERCIGCGYCVVACPYGARYLLPAGERTPRGIGGVADKCTLCYHRITRGREPACVEVCPAGARVFGDLNDASSPVSAILREQPTRVLRADLGTRPRVHYVGLEDEVEA
jgi:tetrathionate reductase subunit B